MMALLRRLTPRRAAGWPAPRRRLHARASWAPPLRVHPSVRAALDAGAPVVALESTIISHGMPWPDNVECALGVEDIVRRAGATPATVAIVDGAVTIGLDSADLERLGRGGASAVRKTSRRDLAAVVAGGGLGATTVSATMIAAELAGIHVFATGGIGGVHRGGAGDVSADLTELGRTPVAVVCAGVKSILDIGLTLEYLETQGVPVITMGADAFPAFYTASSGLPTPLRLDTPAAVAAALHASLRLGLRNGTVVAVPNPAPADGAAMDAAIASALADAAARGVAGRDVTPFLLARVAALTGGASLAANIALVRHNAAVGAAIAVELAALRRMGAADSTGGASFPGGGGGGGGGGGSGAKAAALAVAAAARGRRYFHFAAGGVTPSRRHYRALSQRASSPPPPPLPASALRCVPVVVGGAVVDILAKAAAAPVVARSSNPGRTTQSFGGAGRNMAEAAARLLGGGGGVAPAATLWTVLGADGAGAALTAHASSVGVRVVDVGGAAAGGATAAAATAAHGGRAQSPDPGASAAAAATATATYTAVLDGGGDLVAAVADMAAFDGLDGARLHAAGLRPTASAGPAPPFFIVDGNVPEDGLRFVAALAATSAPPRPPSTAQAAAAAAAGAAPAASLTGGAPLLLDPTSVAKCTRVVSAGALHLFTVVKPNELEVVAMARAWRAAVGLPPDDDEAEAERDGGGSGDPPPAAVAIDDSVDDIVGGARRHGAARVAHAPPRGSGDRRRLATDAAEEVVVTHSVVARPATATDGRGGGAPLTDRLSARYAAAGGAQFAEYLGSGEEREARVGPRAPAPLIHGDAVTSAAPGAGDDDGDGGSDDDRVSYRVLTAAQTVLAGMTRPSGTARPVAPTTLRVALRTLAHYAEAAELATAAAAVGASGAAGGEAVDADADAARAVFASALANVRARDAAEHARAARAVAAPPTAPSPHFPGALIDGRKHLLVTLGRRGVLWLSAPPASTDEDADVSAVLPFFAAAARPGGFDFKILPAPPTKQARCTGAGDVLAGAVVAAVCQGASFAAALEHGLAAAVVAVEAPAGGGEPSTVSAALTPASVAAARALVRAVDGEYA